MFDDDKYVQLFASIAEVKAHRDAFVAELNTGSASLAEVFSRAADDPVLSKICLLYTSPSPRDLSTSRMPSSA